MSGQFQPQFVTIDDLRIRYATSTKVAGRPILLTCPWPESIAAFYAIWPKLADVAPLVAIDLPGFGRSEGRPDVMTPQSMGDFLIKVVSTFSELSMQRPHAIGPDVGTSTMLCAAAKDKEIFSSLIVGAGAMHEKYTDGALKAIIEAPDTSPFEGADGGETVVTSVRGLLKNATEEELQDYRESYAGDRFVKSMAYVRSYPKTLPPLRAKLPSIQTPVLVIYGSHDPLVPAENAEILGRSLPHVRVNPLDAGHFAWEDKADEYAAAVRSWIEGGYQAV
ncbi:MAG TPA: alpha/beta hydrolase [Candidatus Eremiobacteraceae bacterium]|nr:alpha/beta hydrolase [Candidatus Eremiobacteraceae bacterium]